MNRSVGASKLVDGCLEFSLLRENLSVYHRKAIASLTKEPGQYLPDSARKGRLVENLIAGIKSLVIIPLDTIAKIQRKNFALEKKLMRVMLTRVK